MDHGSIPGTLTGLSLLLGHVNVADITGVCEPSDLGSNPSMPTNSTKFRKLGDEKMTEKKPNEKIPPEEMIDHNNANFLQIENVMTILWLTIRAISKMEMIGILGQSGNFVCQISIQISILRWMMILKKSGH